MTKLKPPRLHIGSGEWPYPLWINVDIDQSNRTVDLHADAAHLPFPGETFTHVYCGHFWEHIVWDDIPGIWQEIRRVSTGDALFCIVGPAMDRALNMQVPGWLLEAIEAHGTGPGAHMWTATTALTRQAIELGGLIAKEVPVAQIIRPDWPNPSQVDWQCAFLARASW